MISLSPEQMFKFSTKIVGILAIGLLLSTALNARVRPPGEVTTQSFDVGVSTFSVSTVSESFKLQTVEQFQLADVLVATNTQSQVKAFVLTPMKAELLPGNNESFKPNEQRINANRQNRYKHRYLYAKNTSLLLIRPGWRTLNCNS